MTSVKMIYRWLTLPIFSTVFAVLFILALTLPFIPIHKNYQSETLTVVDYAVETSQLSYNVYANYVTPNGISCSQLITTVVAYNNIASSAHSLAPVGATKVGYSFNHNCYFGDKPDDLEFILYMISVFVIGPLFCFCFSFTCCYPSGCDKQIKCCGQVEIAE